jgi:alpha-2-macroglobulin-like protein
MKSSKFLLTLLCSGILTLTGFITSTEGFLEKLKAKLAAYHHERPEEKVYLQFDKPFYKPGENIWFNAFVLDGVTHKPSAISDVLYVDLKDPKGTMVTSLTLFIKDGTTKGDFTLDEKFPGGMYTVVAYTRWLENWGEEVYFKKDVQVQRVITPRLLMKLDFEKEAYGRGDKVSATLIVNNLKNEPLDHAEVSSVVRVDGATLQTLKNSTDALGHLKIEFSLPGNLSTTDGMLQVLVSHSGQQESISRSIPIVLNRVTLRFFPEGGDIIAGVENRIAFKATNEFGKGADVEGVIIDEHNTTIARFTSFHMGMGAFSFTPRTGQKYRARVAKPAGIDSIFTLPASLKQGYALSFAGLTSASTLEVLVNSPETGQVFLIAQSHGFIYYADKIDVRKGVNTVSISKDLFPAGIAVFTLFNGVGLEEAERLVFLNAEKKLNISVETDRKDYKPGDQVKVKITTRDEAGKPIPAKLSLAVVDDQLISFADDKQDNILSWMLMSSELKGKVQEPSFYFDPKEPKAGKALDLVMLTHGWRRFTWKDILKNNKALAWLPENNSTISGRVIDSKKQSKQTEVVLLELGNRRRLAKVRTTHDGHFNFKNVDASTSLLLLTRKPDQIELPGKKTVSLHSDKSRNALQPFNREDIVTPIVTEERQREDDAPLPVMDAVVEQLSMVEDAAQLSEVIVTGYGAENRKDITGSITKVEFQGLDNIAGYASFESMLQGRVAGLQIQQQNANPGTAPGVMIRGISSNGAGRREPLYVVDGIPIGNNLNQNFANGSIIGLADIRSIEIMQAPEASAFFGSAAANGVVMISTKPNVGFMPFHDRQRKSKYFSLLISPREFSVTREFYAEASQKHSNNERKNFSTTVYWNHTLVTNEQGEATTSFYNNDATSSFRITTEGMSATGLIGRLETVYSATLPFSVDTRIPQFLGFEDTLLLPVMVKNSTSAPLEAQLSLSVSEGLKVLTPTELSFKVEPLKTGTVHLKVVADNIAGEFPIVIKVKADNFQDEIKHAISVHPVGFPVRMSFSGKQLDKEVRFHISDLEQGSLKAEAMVFTDVLADLFTGAESILRQPHGCFEQVSSSTFPNILALQFLKESGQSRPDLEKRAMAYIESGYKQLAAYEIKGGGFEWFGHPPAHEALTAFGLIEFYEMQKVFDGVSASMLKRTRDWILSRRKGDGTFSQTNGKYGFSSASSTVNNAYLVYALAETGTTDLEKEYGSSLDEAWKSGDMYRMALMANAADALQKRDDHAKLVNEFIRQAISSGFATMKADHSVVRSYGNSLQIEMVSLWCIAMMRGPEPDLSRVNECIQFILSKRSDGMFGSTQATSLALKALTDFTRLVRTQRQDGEFALTINHHGAQSAKYTGNTREKIVLNGFVGDLREGENLVQVKFNNTTEPLPYSVNISWNTKTPVSDNNCKVGISTTLSQQTVNVNETVRLVVGVQNVTDTGVPMVMGVVGIPAGLSLQPWQLKELQEKQVFDFYEVIGDRLAIYYRELEPNATRTIKLDLKAEVAGSFTGVASCAYLYYTDEYKTWVKGSTITIR